MKRIPLLFTCLLTVLLVSGCKKSSDEATGPKASKDYYFQAKVDNQNVLIEADRTGLGGSVAAASYVSQSSGGGYELSFQTGSIQPYNSSTAANSVLVSLVKKVVTESDLEREQWKQMMYSLFKPGDYTFGKYNTDSETIDPKTVTEGIVIFYYDAKGELWGTTLGSGDQSGSRFTITSVVKNTDPISAADIKQVVTAEFSGKLYNHTGASKTITGGKLKLMILTHPNFLAND